ncbi:YiiX/YebB-like N1pC/P60 family cysteine hydrolase [Phenylobacterium sp.]|jgi:hypothetical protein|uniref:YiiX/YebB-like N1pC/P60 family cysteine hydrolase n=1 Tax=Phenylobacterium sp. TaxID=1871053 RepID=UPI0039C8D31E
MAIEPDALERLRPQPYGEIREEVRDGDLLLCSANDSFSRLIRWATKSPWSHVAIAYRLEEIDRVIILECVEKIGVRAVPLSSFISRTSNGEHPYPGRILLARHRGMAAKSRRKPWRRNRELCLRSPRRSVLGDRDMQDRPTHRREPLWPATASAPGPQG